MEHTWLTLFLLLSFLIKIIIFQSLLRPELCQLPSPTKLAVLEPCQERTYFSILALRGLAGKCWKAEVAGHSSAEGCNIQCSRGFSSTLLSGTKAALMTWSHRTVQALKCSGSKQAQLAACGNSSSHRKNILLHNQNQNVNRRIVYISLWFKTLQEEMRDSLKGEDLLNKDAC